MELSVRIQAEVYKRGMATLESFSQSMTLGDQRMEMYFLILVAILLCFIFKILNVNNSPEKSLFYCSSQQFLDEFLKKAPELTQPYVPTRFWGYSGHLQTIIQVRYFGASELSAMCYSESHCAMIRESCSVSTLWILIGTILKLS